MLYHCGEKTKTLFFLKRKDKKEKITAYLFLPIFNFTKTDSVSYKQKLEKKNILFLLLISVNQYLLISVP